MSNKVIVQETTRTEREIELEYPIYLYFQGDFLDETCIMDDGKKQLRVEWELHSVGIREIESEKYTEEYLRRNLTTREHFMEMYQEVLQLLTKTVSND